MGPIINLMFFNVVPVENAVLRPRASVSRPLILRPTQPALRAGRPNALAVPELVDAAMPMQLLSDATAAAEPALRQTEESIRAASGELGWWGTYIKTVEDGILSLHDSLQANGVPFPYGSAIFCFVLGVKFVTLPLNWNQLSSSAQMKTLQPAQAMTRKWYGDNTQLMNQEVGALFEKNSINPLSGCLPSLAQIPVFLGVYYSVTSIAKARIFDEGFLWIPSLSGPIADRREGLSWLTEGWIDGVPKLGWHDTLCYLTIPLILVCTQTLSLYLLGSFEALGEKEENQTASTALRLLPLMIGWFAMNAPSGLGLYWVFNNILTTTQTVVIKKVLEKPPIETDVTELVAAIGPRRATLAASTSQAPDWVPVAPPSEVLTAAIESESVSAESV